MTDPLNPKNFNRSDSELEEWLLFCIFVAGKNSKTQQKKLHEFLDLLGYPEYPIKLLSDFSEALIGVYLREVKMGQYNRLTKCLHTLSHANLDLRTCTTEQLESIPGIGMKTSRFFITYSRETNDYAVLDTHILSWMRENGYDAPLSTPTNPKQYKELERLFLEECKKRNMTPQELDFNIWESRQTSWSIN